MPFEVDGFLQATDEFNKLARKQENKIELTLHPQKEENTEEPVKKVKSKEDKNKPTKGKNKGIKSLTDSDYKSDVIPEYNVPKGSPKIGGKRYHISDDLVPRLCSAEEGRCPYGGLSTHYDSIEEAQSVIDDRMLKQENNSELSVPKNSHKNKNDNLYDKIKIKESPYYLKYKEKFVNDYQLKAFNEDDRYAESIYKIYLESTNNIYFSKGLKKELNLNGYDRRKIKYALVTDCVENFINKLNEDFDNNYNIDELARDNVKNYTKIISEVDSEDHIENVNKYYSQWFDDLKKGYRVDDVSFAIVNQNEVDDYINNIKSNIIEDTDSIHTYNKDKATNNYDFVINKKYRATGIDNYMSLLNRSGNFYPKETVEYCQTFFAVKKLTDYEFQSRQKATTQKYSVYYTLLDTFETDKFTKPKLSIFAVPIGE